MRKIIFVFWAVTFQSYVHAATSITEQFSTSDCRVVHGVGDYRLGFPWDGDRKANADLDAERKCSGEVFNPGIAQRVTSYALYRVGAIFYAEADYVCCLDGSPEFPKGTN
jgi:hypothetical protein